MGGTPRSVLPPIATGSLMLTVTPPIGYLEPGPDQHLDGFHALWFARGRWGSDDYERMLRQRCMIAALIEAADPVTLIRRYLDLADAGEEIVRTDVPKSLLPAFVNLALKAKDHQVRSIAFVTSSRFFSGDPDFVWMQESVRRALAAGAAPPVTPSSTGSPTPSPTASPTTAPTTSPTSEPDPGAAVDVPDTCAYLPEG